MPFLKQEEFESIVPRDLALQLTRNPGEFEEAEKAAAEEVAAITGEAVPSDAAQAPAWTKRPTAHIIFWNRLGVLPITADLRAWVEKLYMNAIENLKLHQAKQPAGRVDAQLCEIEGMVKW